LHAEAELLEVVSKTEFARSVGVSPARVSQWLRDGTVSQEALLGHGRHARVKVDLALEMLRNRLDLARSATSSRGRTKLGSPDEKSGLTTARTKTSNLQAALLQMRLARELGDVIPKGAATAAIEALGRAVQRAHKGIPCWAEEITAAAQIGGIGAVSGVLRLKSGELLGSIADMIVAAAELIEDPPERGQ
jgi:phage terminase Nu1 subunit (DNA packaging protein)